MTITQSLQQLIDVGYVTQGETLGVDESTIFKLENSLGKKLSEDYVEFLKICGFGCGPFWSSLDFSFDRIEKINEDFWNDIRLIQKDEINIAIPQHAFAIGSFRGENYLWIQLGSTREPVSPVFDLDILNASFKKTHESLTERICRDVRNIISNRKIFGIEP